MTKSLLFGLTTEMSSYLTKCGLRTNWIFSTLPALIAGFSHFMREDWGIATDFTPGILTSILWLCHAVNILSIQRQVEEPDFFSHSLLGRRTMVLGGTWIPSSGGAPCNVRCEDIPS